MSVLVAAVFMIGLVCCGEQLLAQSSTTTEAPDFDPLSQTRIVKPYQYRPFDAKFWQNIEDALNDEEQIQDGISMAQKRIERSPKGSAGEGEAWLALGRVLSRIGFPVASSNVFKRIAIEFAGQDAGEYAIYQLDLLARDNLVDPSEIESLVVSFDFYNLHPEVQSFASYYRSLHHLRNKLNEWFVEEQKLLAPKSFWRQQWDFDVLIQNVSKNRIETPVPTLTKIIESTETPKQIRQKAILQRARVYFEEGEFQKAFADYESLTGLPLREQGRIFLEMAWCKFYLKDFSKALGLLAVLKINVHRPSIHPERYILEALIYRQLCHYPSVGKVFDQFDKAFGKALTAIHQRKQAGSSMVLARMALMNPKFQKIANLVFQMREESQQMKRLSLKDRYKKTFLDYYESKDEELLHRQELMLEEEARQAALELLDAEEQMVFLNYSAKIDSLRIVRVGEDRDYNSENISKLTFDKYYWQVGTEHWRDELPDYKVLISSRCNDSVEVPRSREKR